MCPVSRSSNTVRKSRTWCIYRRTQKILLSDRERRAALITMGGRVCVGLAGWEPKGIETRGSSTSLVLWRGRIAPILHKLEGCCAMPFFNKINCWTIGTNGVEKSLSHFIVIFIFLEWYIVELVHVFFWHCHLYRSPFVACCNWFTICVWIILLGQIKQNMICGKKNASVVSHT